MNKLFLSFASTLMLTLSISIQIKAQPVLDNTYSSDGYLLSNVSPSDADYARSVLVQPNGRILTGGNSIDGIGNADIRIIRTKTNGAMDNTFGASGIATIPGGFFCDMALLPNGKIIVAGSGVGPTNVNNFIVYRLTKNGMLDNTFGIGGSVEVNIANQHMICFDVVIQADGKIVLGGYLGGYGNNDMLIVRLKPNGNLDNSFATGGKFTFLQASKNSECKQLAIQPDGKIIAAGTIDTLLFFASLRYDFAAIRLTTTGTLDNTFGAGGVVRADKGTSDIAYAVSILSDGRIVLGGSTNYLGNSQFAALGLLSNGSIDNTFGTSGWTYFDFYGGGASCTAMVAEPDDDIIMAGLAYIFDGVSYQTIALAKLLSNGTPDITFGINGIDTSFNSIIGETCSDIALQSDNKIVISGYRATGTSAEFLTARYTNSAAFMKQAKENIVIENNFNIYPNPNYGDFVITTTSPIKENTRITISNLTGQIFYTENISAQEKPSNISIELIHDLSEGIYFVNIKTNDQVITKQFIVIR